MLFIIQRGDARSLAVARDIDPAYGKAFDEARGAGVEMLARRCDLSIGQITVAEAVPLAD